MCGGCALDSCMGKIAVHALPGPLEDLFVCMLKDYNFVSALFSSWQLSNIRHMEPYIITSLALFGFFGFGMYPICFELGVECVYPISEGTSAGLMAMSG